MKPGDHAIWTRTDRDDGSREVRIVEPDQARGWWIVRKDDRDFFAHISELKHVPPGDERG